MPPPLPHVTTSQNQTRPVSDSLLEVCTVLTIFLVIALVVIALGGGGGAQDSDPNFTLRCRRSAFPARRVSSTETKEFPTRYEEHGIEAAMGLPSPGLRSQSLLGRRLRTSGDRWRQTSVGRAVADTKSWPMQVANCPQRVRNMCQLKLLPGHAAYHWEGLHASLCLRRKAG